MPACSNCGAKLPIVAPGLVQVCAYCGAQQREAMRAPQIIIPSVDLPPRSSSVAPFLIILFAVLAVGGGAVIIAVARQSSSSGSSAGANPVNATQSPGAPAKPKLTLANLATTPIQGIEPIDAPGMIGTFDAFDPIANYEWAKTIAHAWKPDAVLNRIDADRVAKDGLLNIKSTPDALAMFRFHSPKCVNDFANSTAVVPPKNECGLFVKVKVERGAPAACVQVVAESPSSMERSWEIQSPVCTMAKAFAALEKAGKLPERPVYNAYLIDIRFHGPDKPEPRWSFDQIISGGPSIGFVNAVTCAIK